jgi:hypothetical protein
MRMVSGKLCLTRHLAKCFFWALLTSAVLLAGAAAQDVATGVITGTVSSSKGGTISGARIFITNRTTGQTTSVTSNDQGHFSSAPVPAADFVLRIEGRAFVARTVALTVHAGPATLANITLDPLPVPGIVEPVRQGELPFAAQSFLEAAEIEPGIQLNDAGAFAPTRTGFPALSFLDGTGRTTPHVEVDGVAVTDETTGFVAQNIPLSAVQEFHFGGVLGPISEQLYSPGALNFITRSGGNELHGDIFGLYRNGDVLSASLPGGHSHDWGRQMYGGAVGGAIIPEKLFFFVDAQRNKQDLANPVLVAGPFSGLTPASTTISEPFREFETTDRLDYVLSPSTRAFYRFTYDRSSDTAPFGQGPSLQAYRSKNNSPSNTLGLDFTSGDFVQSLRFEYLRFKDTLSQPSSSSGTPTIFSGPTINIGGGAMSQCNTGSLYCAGPSPFAAAQTQQSDLQFRYDGSRVWNAHLFHAGASFNRIHVGGFNALYSLVPSLSDPGSVALPAGILGSTGNPADPLNYPVQWAFLGNGQGFTTEKSAFGLPGGGLVDNQIDLYAGDTWKVKPRVTVTYGLHWLRDTGRSNSDLPAIPALNSLGPGLGAKVRQPNMNFAPQVGVSWDASSSGKTIVRAGAGLFYDVSAFQIAMLDRPLRLSQGTFLSTPAACVGGAPGEIQWPNAGAAGTSIASGAGIVNTNGTVSPTWCGQSIGLAGPQAIALQQAYQAATAAAAGTNASYIGNAGSFAGPYANGLSLLSPDYQTPRTAQFNIGIQHELWPGMVLTLDYVRDVTTRTLLGVDVNQGGSASTFNVANAMSDRDAAQSANGCLTGAGQVSCMVAKLGPAGALAAYGNAGIGGPAQVTGGAPCPSCAFPGIRPAAGVNVMQFPVGRSVYTGELFGLKQQVTNFSRGVQRASFEFSYAHSKNVGQAEDEMLGNLATDYANPDRFTGPTGLDRTHQLSIGAHFDLQKSLQLSFIAHLLSPLSATPRFQQTSGGAEVLVTDWNGDGSTGDIVEGGNVGSYMRNTKPSGLQSFISNYNSSVANGSNPQTPAGQQLITGGVFSLPELVTLGGVQQPLAAAVPDPAGMGWFKTLDIRLGWVHRFSDRVEIVPSVGLFNAFNFANFDLPGNTQNGILNFGAASLSPWATALQPQNTIGGTSGTGVTGRVNRASFGPGMNAAGAPRSIEWGVKISF